jgi:hypothetical protein
VLHLLNRRPTRSLAFCAVVQESLLRMTRCRRCPLDAPSSLDAPPSFDIFSKQVRNVLHILNRRAKHGASPPYLTAYVRGRYNLPFVPSLDHRSKHRKSFISFKGIERIEKIAKIEKIEVKTVQRAASSVIKKHAQKPLDPERQGNKS